MISASGAYSTLEAAGQFGVSESRKKQVPQVFRKRARLQAFDQRNRIAAGAHLLMPFPIRRFDMITHEVIELRPQLIDFLAIVEIHLVTVLGRRLTWKLDQIVSAPAR